MSDHADANAEHGKIPRQPERLPVMVVRDVLELRAQGKIRWSGRRFRPKGPVAKLMDGGTIAELIINERR